MLERRNGFARGIYNRLHDGGRFVGRYYANAMPTHRGFSAYQLAFGPDRADLPAWQDTDADSDFV